MPPIRGQSLGQKLCVSVVLGQLLRSLFQRNESGGSEDASLPHAASERFAIDAGAIHQLCAAHQQRSDGRAQSFGEAEHDRVGLGCQLRHRDAEGDGSVEDPRSIQMHRQAHGM